MGPPRLPAHVRSQEERHGRQSGSDLRGQDRDVSVRKEGRVRHASPLPVATRPPFVVRPTSNAVFFPETYVSLLCGRLCHGHPHAIACRSGVANPDLTEIVPLRGRLNCVIQARLRKLLHRRLSSAGAQNGAGGLHGDPQLSQGRVSTAARLDAFNPTPKT